MGKQGMNGLGEQESRIIDMQGRPPRSTTKLHPRLASKGGRVAQEVVRHAAADERVCLVVVAVGDGWWMGSI